MDQTTALEIFERFKRSEIDVTGALKEAAEAYISAPFVAPQTPNTEMLTRR